MIWAYEAFLLNAEYAGTVNPDLTIRQLLQYYPMKGWVNMQHIDPASLQHLEWTYLKDYGKAIKIFSKLSAKLKDSKIYNVVHMAKGEIEKLVYVNNNNAPRLIRRINNDINKLLPQVDKIIKDQQLNHVDKMPAYRTFFESVQWLWDFADWFKNEVDNCNKLDDSKQTKEPNITNPMVAMFCVLVNNSGIDKHGPETIAEYCIRVCDKYNLPYKERVSKKFSRLCSGQSHLIKRYIEKIQELILPKLDKSTRDNINNYLNNKYPSTSKLFG